MSRRIEFDPTTLVGLQKIMDDYSNCGNFYGSNKNGENVTVAVCTNEIVQTTYQYNGWIHKNIFHRDGTREEMFEGKWK